MKRILLVSSEGLGNGGVSVVIMNIVRNLSSEFVFDILLFTKEKRMYDDEFLKYGGEIYRVPINGKDNPENDLKNKFIRPFVIMHYLNSLMSRVHYDIIHCHNEIESGLCLKVAEKHGVKIRVSQAHIVTDYSGHYFSAKTAINKIYLQLISRYTTCALGCSEEACRALFDNKSFQVINNFIDLKEYEKYKNPTNKIHNSFGHVGRIGDFKNQKFIIKVFSIVHSVFKDSTLTMIGSGDSKYREELIDSIEQLGLKECVTLLPGESSVPDLFSKCEYMIFPSNKGEGFGIVLIEAQTLGVYCFVSSCTPRAADVGLCTFYPLIEGENWWGNKIISFMRQNEGSGTIYPNMDKFEVKYIIDLYRQIYNK